MLLASPVSNSKYTPQFRVLITVQTQGRNNQIFLSLFRKRAKAMKFRGLILQLLYFRSYLINKYRVSQEEWTKLRESVPYVKVY